MANAAGVVGGSGPFLFRWQRGADGAFEYIEGADGYLYTVGEDDRGARIRVVVTRAEIAGEIGSDPTDVVPLVSDFPVAEAFLDLAADIEDGNAPDRVVIETGIPEERFWPHALGFAQGSGRSIEIVVRAGTPGDVLALDRQGAIFTVGNGVTLVLEGVELRGRDDNDRVLVAVDSGGTLIMREGSRIAGNVNNAIEGGGGGGVRVGRGGRLILDGGEIVGNSTTYGGHLPGSPGHGGGVRIEEGGFFEMISGAVSGNRGMFGGGIEVQGVFVMRGGEVSGNTAVEGGGVDVYRGTFDMLGGVIAGNSAADSGGGVLNAGLFRMGSGIIRGLNEEDEASRNTAPIFAALSRAIAGGRDPGTRRGAFAGDTFNDLGTLSTTDNTVHLVDGFPPHFGDFPIHEFWAADLRDDSNYRLTAERLAYNQYAEVWVGVGTSVTPGQAADFAAEFAGFRGRLLEAFGRPPFSAGGRSFADILAFGNWIARGDAAADGRLTILVLEVEDFASFTTGGYFDTRDFFDGAHSNRRDMVYIHAPFLTRNWDAAVEILAHELTHLINHSEAVLGSLSHPQNEVIRPDTWIDEGLAEKSFYVIRGENPEHRIEWFIEDPEGTISGGNNFFAWDNYWQVPGAVLDDYATAYLFFRWLHLHAFSAPGADHTELLRRIVTSQYSDHRAVTSVAADIDPAWGNWEVLLRNWLAANFFPANPFFGYVGDPDLSGRLMVRPRGGQFIQLFSGEGAFSIMNGPFSSPVAGDGVYIGHAGISRDGAMSVGPGPLTGEVLLTFNANTVTNEPNQRGTLKGVTPPASAARRLADLRSGVLWDRAGRGALPLPGARP